MKCRLFVVEQYGLQVLIASFPYVLVAVKKGMQMVKLCSNKVLPVVNWGAG